MTLDDSPKTPEGLTPVSKPGARAYMDWARYCGAPLCFISLLIFMITQITRYILFIFF